MVVAAEVDLKVNHLVLVVLVEVVLVLKEVPESFMGMDKHLLVVEEEEEKTLHLHHLQQDHLDLVVPVS